MLRFVWPSPISAMGLVLAAFVRLSGGRVAPIKGAVEVSGGVSRHLLWLINPFMRIEAITLGHVVLGKDTECLARMRAHERVHVRQYERWGPIFPIAYLGASVLAWASGKCAYRDNVFEVEAFAVDRLPPKLPREMPLR